MIDLTALRYAILASDAHSFARAAIRANVKQATLSKRIAEMEARLGIQLFDRSTRGAVPTETGAAFLSDARRVIGELDALHMRAKAIGGGRAGTLGIGFSASLAGGDLRMLVTELNTYLPDVRLSLVEADREALTNALDAGAVDLAVVAGRITGDAILARQLWSERVMVVLPNDHPMTEAERVYWPDLRKERFLLSRQDPGGDLAALARVRLAEPGCSPDVRTVELSRENTACLTALNGMVGLATTTSLVRPPPGVALKDVHEPTGGTTTLGYAGYWRRDNNNPALTHLLALLDERYPSAV